MAITRERLFEEVWAEPMTTVAARYKVSSSFLGRICERLKVPRPGRGHWAQVAVGKADAKPALPPPRPGDELEWARDREARRLPAALPVPLDHDPLPTASSSAPRRRGEHALLLGARADFQKTRGGSSFWNEYPRPTKHNLADIVVSAEGLDRGLSLANKLYLALESRGFNVTLAARPQQWRRPEVDPCESKAHPNHTPRCWSPARPTLCYVGSVAIGLTIYELSEAALSERVDGKTIRISEAAAKRKRSGRSYYSESKDDFPTGRFALRTYSPYPDTTWTREWREAKTGQLGSQLDDISKSLHAASSEIAGQAKEAHERAEVRRKQWEEQQRQWEREKAERLGKEAEALQAKLRKDSHDQLVGIIGGWALARDMETFFTQARENTRNLTPNERAAIEARLEQARLMFGGTEPLDHFKAWLAPDERRR